MNTSDSVCLSKDQSMPQKENSRQGQLATLALEEGLAEDVKRSSDM